MCNAPVGLGAKRTLTLLSAIIIKSISANIFVQNYNKFFTIYTFPPYLSAYSCIKAACGRLAGRQGRVRGQPENRRWTWFLFATLWVTAGCTGDMTAS
jgi:hypothetical protein